MLKLFKKQIQTRLTKGFIHYGRLCVNLLKAVTVLLQVEAVKQSKQMMENQLMELRSKVSSLQTDLDNR